MLDEFANITRCHRRRAIRVLPAHARPWEQRPHLKGMYHEARKEALIVLGKTADCVCGK
jgi:hypothetical protein